MPADRFFIDAELKRNETVLLAGPEHHHLAHVMRLKEGDELELVNGRGDLALGKISEVRKKETLIQLLKSGHEPDTKTARVFLGVPLMRASKLEWIVEKGTELGVDAFLFYRAAHSELEELHTRHLERLHALIVSALKQSGRLYLPSVEVFPALESLLNREAQVLFGDLSVKKMIEKNPTASKILFVSGPERGFSKEEETLLSEKGEGVSLSRYVLRAETAPIVAASILGVQ
jgi:16S rRNA (uracil1498-N3)-methyltransferase